MNIVQRAKLAFSNNAMQEYIQRFMLGEDVYEINTNLGDRISTTLAMKYTAVFACMRVLGETFASVPAMLYIKKSGGERDARNDLAVFDILHNRPNEDMSPFNFKEACMNALNLGGNAVCERLVTRRGETVGLYPYQWQQVRIQRDPETRRLQYQISAGTQNGTNNFTNQIDDTQGKTLWRNEVFHVPGLSLDGIVGLSPIEYAASAIRLGMSYEQFGVNFYKNGANPSGAMVVPGALSEEAYKRLKKEMKENWTGMKNTGKPLLLEGGTKFEQFTIKPADAQLIENKKFQIEDIARIYRVPLHLIQNLDRATNNNIEHQSLEFVMYTMLPWFKRWEENINMQLLTPAERRAGFYVEFKLDGLLRGDQQSRARAYALGRQWGWLSVNDIRKLENLPQIANGNRYLEPTNMTEAGSQKQFEAMAKEIVKMLKEGGAAA